MSLTVRVGKRALAQAAALPDAERAAARSALAALPGIFGHPHRHAGIGLRKLRPGLFEVRAGLSIRVVFERAGDVLNVVLIGNHDDVRRFLRGG